MLVVVVAAVVIVATAIPTITPITLVIIVARYQQSLTSATSFIVGPMESTQLTTVVTATLSSPATKMVQYVPIKWVGCKRLHHVGVGLSLPELLGGVRVK